MSLLAKKNQTKVLTGDTFQIANMAKEAKSQFSDVINSTVGALYDDYQTFYEYRTVSQNIKKIPVETHYSYAPTSGGEPFKKNIMNWVFQNHLPLIQEKFAYDLVATPGGTGALYNTFYNYLEEDDVLIMPNIYWTNYITMLRHAGVGHLTYSMFKDDKFNFQAFVQATKEVLKKKKKIVALFNDPAHNPTGYSMSLAEWKKVYHYLNKLANDGVQVIVLYDLAYIDYEGKTFKDSRKAFAALNEIDSNLLVLMAFSGSKSFSLYGLRMGAQIAISQSKEHIKDFKNAAVFSARSTWSCPPSTGIYMANRVFSDEKETKKFIRELNTARKMLRSRLDVFLAEAEEIGLPLYPYKGGFFVTIPYEETGKGFDLLAKNRLFTIEVPGGLRLAICSIPVDQVRGMAERIKRILF
ncbi:MAG: aminotransferase class I/II-fold pyridoxal phosphate-dependent enzyme [Acholeplasmataceae bacterium]